jgi:hypothetical protein
VPRVWVMFMLFLSSYLPLFLLIGVRSIDRANLISVGCGLLVIAGALGTWLFLRTARQKPKGRYKMLDVERRDGDVAGYAATYLLPFVTVFSGHWQDVTTVAAFIAFLGFVYVRSRLIYVNPLLMVLGYHLWRVVPETHGQTVKSNEVRWPKYLLVDNETVRKGQVISAHRVTNDLLLFDEEIEIDGAVGTG